MKKHLTLWIAIALSIQSLSAAKIGNLYYQFNFKNQTAVVISQNGRSPYWSTSITTANIPSSIKYDEEPYRVIGIGEHAFHGCTSLTSLTIPNSVTSIGVSAFNGCTVLTSVTLPNSVTSIGNYAFYNCASMTSLTISNSVTSIGEYAVSGCGSLTSVTIPDGVTTIKKGAFSGCMGLTSIIIPNSVTTIEQGAFSGCTSLTSITIPNSVTSIGSSAFSGCTSLTSITIPNSVTSIGSSAFSGCTSLTSVMLNSNAILSNTDFFGNTLKDLFGNQVTEYIIGENVTSIGSYAFYDCTNVTSITISNSVTSIGDEAFSGCDGLTSPVYNAHIFARMPISYSGAYVIPSDIDSIVGGAFSYCTHLTSITIPDNITSINSSAFEGCDSLMMVTVNSNSIISKNYSNTSSLKNIFGEQVETYFLGDSVTRIGNYAFASCTSLTSITIPHSVTGIGDYAFSGCDSLNTVTINSNTIVSKGYSSTSNFKNIFGEQVEVYILGESIARIGTAVFSGCTNLTSITIPNSVTSIGEAAFSRCNGLTSINLPSSLTSIESTAFAECIGITSLTLPNSVTSIGVLAFRDCSSLNSVTIGNSVESINLQAFQGCTNLTSVHINDLAAWCAISFGNELSNPLCYAHNLYINDELTTSLVIPDGVAIIGNLTFYNCSNLTSVDIPNSVTNIAKQAFQGCTNLTSVHINDLAAWCAISFEDIYSNPLYYAHNLYLNDELITNLEIPQGVTRIGKYAFYNCNHLTTVVIPNSVITIGGSSFSKCSSLDSVIINSDAILRATYSPSSNLKNKFGEQVKSYILGDSIIKIGDYAFYKCTGLTSITIPNSTTSIGEYTFSGCSGLTSVTIGNRVTNIGNYAFYNCASMTSLTISNSVTSIGEYAVSGCTGLTSVTIPNSITSIGEGTFSECSNLESIEFPNSIKHVGQYAFTNCNNVTHVTCHSIIPPAMAEYVFDGMNCSRIPLYVPKKSITDYKNANQWKNFKPILAIDSIDDDTIPREAITVRLDPKSVSKWSEVRLWAWNYNGNMFNAWPGIVVNRDETEWYSYTFDISVPSVNIIWTNGTDQTIDIEDITISTCFALDKTSGKNITASIVDCPTYEERHRRFIGFEATNDNKMGIQIYTQGLIQDTHNITLIETDATKHKYDIKLTNGGEGTFLMGGITFSYTDSEAGKTAYKTYDMYIQPNGFDREIRIPTYSGQPFKIILVEGCDEILIDGVSTNLVAGDNLVIASKDGTTINNPSSRPKITGILPIGGSQDINVVHEDQESFAPRKVMIDGQILILRGEKVYTLQGQEVK